MKKSLRIASAALALTLAASCAVPAFAAGSSSFSKDETVYAVMNGDGSLKSTTVSEHLYILRCLHRLHSYLSCRNVQQHQPCCGRY